MPKPRTRVWSLQNVADFTEEEYVKAGGRPEEFWARFTRDDAPKALAAALLALPPADTGKKPDER
jgi:hypothetical protein